MEDTNVPTTSEDVRKRKPAENFLSIVSGRLPFIFVHAIRFNDTVKAMGSNKAIADTFGTSIGKVFDIVKGRNFGYIDADWRPTEADVAAARDWIARIGSANKHGLTSLGNANALTTIVDDYEAGGMASPEQAAAFAQARAATRAKPEGGAKRGRKPKAEVTQGAAEDLLA